MCGHRWIFREIRCGDKTWNEQQHEECGWSLLVYVSLNGTNIHQGNLAVSGDINSTGCVQQWVHDEHHHCSIYSILVDVFLFQKGN